LETRASYYLPYGIASSLKGLYYGLVDKNLELFNFLLYLNFKSTEEDMDLWFPLLSFFIPSLIEDPMIEELFGD
jgi:hypothetical protein